MRSAAVVHLGVLPDLLSGFRRQPVVVGAHLILLDRPPEPLDEYVVQSTPVSVHADLHPGVFLRLQERRRGVLHTLVAVEDLRLFVAPQRSLKQLDPG